MIRAVRCSAAAVLAMTAAVLAADHPVGGDRLLLTDPPNAARRVVRFRAARDPAIDPHAAGDPRSVGATLEIAGAGPGDGATGTVSLDPAHWIGLGRPAGNAGYRYDDRAATTGVRRVIFHTGPKNRGLLVVTGGGAAWPYRVTRPQGAIDVRFTVGAGDVYCAHFTSFSHNAAPRVTARGASPPADCTPSTPGACGNGIAEGSEECDDGNLMSGDGCSATCQLENTSAVCAGVPTVAGTAIHSVRIAAGLEKPTAVTAPRLDPNRVFVVEQPGRIRIIENDVLQATPFLDIAGKVSCCGERGLLSVAFPPDYESSGLFFVNYTNNSGDTVIARYNLSGDPAVADGTSEHILTTIAQPFANHNGGDNVFGPDGFLYVGMGDGGDAGDPGNRAQNDAELLGKLLRIDPVSEAVQIWAKGLRNPWRFSFDRGTGDLYIADVGQGAWEEVDFQPAPTVAGVNYGWHIMEGRHCFNPSSGCDQTGLTLPVLEYDHSNGCSITGGFVYRGCRMPDLRGTYFYSDYCSAFIRTFRGVSGGDAQNLADRTGDLAPGGGFAIDSVTSFGEDARGELYIADYGAGGTSDGKIYKIVPGS